MNARRPVPGSRSTAGGVARPCTTHHMTDSRETAPRRHPFHLARLAKDTKVSAELHMQVQRERARREITLGAIRAHLEEEPSPSSIRACARRWCTAITDLADEVASATNSTETHE